MSVAVGPGGLTGWRLLQRTLPQQIANLSRDPRIAREAAHFAAATDHYDSAEGIVGDRETLKVALTAFGLEADLPNRAFIRKVLESDLRDPASLAHRLSDKRYLGFAQAFGLGPGGIRPRPDALADRVGTQFLEREFERQVGDADPALRLALNARRELALLADRTSSETTRWFEVLGTPPLRSVLEGALGLPAASVRMPIDRQAEMFRDAAERRFGSDFFTRMKNPEARDAVIDSFLARAALSTPARSGPYSAALAILSA